jgi:hypothetical protein
MEVRRRLKVGIVQIDIAETVRSEEETLTRRPPKLCHSVPEGRLNLAQDASPGLDLTDDQSRRDG